MTDDVQVVIDCSGARDDVAAALRAHAGFIADAIARSPDELAALIAARDESMQAREQAIAEYQQRRAPADESKLPKVAHLPPHAELPRDVLDDIAEIVEFAITRVAKMDAHAAGCTIRLAPNKQLVPGIRGDRVLGGWTATISYAVYPDPPAPQR